jgi:hypothetical protein
LHVDVFARSASNRYSVLPLLSTRIGPKAELRSAMVVAAGGAGVPAGELVTPGYRPFEEGDEEVPYADPP